MEDALNGKLVVDGTKCTISTIFPQHVPLVKNTFALVHNKS